jgi:multiple sugar transport system substrate-binding protein
MPIRKAWAESLIEIGKTGTGVYQSPTERVPEARDIIGTAVQEIVQGASPADAARKADEALAKLQ